MFKTVIDKTTANLAREWDALAPVRYRQIESGEDLTFKHVLVPNMLVLAEEAAPINVLDAGCGVGIFTNHLAKKFPKVTGIDPSATSIKIARSHFENSAMFVNLTLEEFAFHCDSKFELVAANMVLMDVLNLDTFLAAAQYLLQPGGRLIFSITHPWFWPAYYGYENEPWFRYERETIIEAPFRISAQPFCGLASTHVHRPLEAYVSALRNAGFRLDQLREPKPASEIEKLYSERWKYPRYLLGSCIRSDIDTH